MYYISIDPSGKLGWESNKLTYINTTVDIIEVLTEKASNAYKAFYVDWTFLILLQAKKRWILKWYLRNLIIYLGLKHLCWVVGAC